MRAKPLILITPSTDKKGIEFADYSLSLSDAYPRAVQAAGGIPWVLAATPTRAVVAESVRRAGGVMLTGGDDVAAELFAPDLEAPLKKKILGADPRRDLTELLVIREVFRQRKPLLAICRGLQILNVALGGDLIVDIPTQCRNALRHNRMDRKTEAVHAVTLAKGSLLRRLFRKDSIGVNSTHHQAAGKIAPALQPTAWSADGIVEAMELNPAQRDVLPYLLAVQFHPERLLDRHAEFGAIFRSLVRAGGSARRASL